MAKQAQNTQLATANDNLFTNLFTPEQKPNFTDFTIEKVDEESGEVVTKAMFKYLQGMPKQYRFDGKAGGFNIIGLGADTKIETLVIQPIAYRFFEDDLMGMGHKQWVEIAFIDDAACVSVVMFHTHSRQSLEAKLEELFYAEKGLNEVKLEITCTMHKAEKVQGKPVFAIAQFKLLEADAAETKLLKTYAATKKIYRKATMTSTAVHTLVLNWFIPEVEEAAV